MYAFIRLFFRALLDNATLHQRVKKTFKTTEQEDRIVFTIVFIIHRNVCLRYTQVFKAN